MKNSSVQMREIGNKLVNFRKKLALAIGEKKITQSQFGAMFGGYNKRQINSYETGMVEIPARLLYAIWKSGNSLDGLFGEQEINATGIDTARGLHSKALIAEQVVMLDNLSVEQALKGARNEATARANRVVNDTPQVNARGNSKTRQNATRQKRTRTAKNYRS